MLNKIGDEADNSKQKKMQKALRKNGHILNRLYEELAKKGACSCCDCAPKKDDSDLCQNCDDLILIGSRLMKSEFIKFNSSKLATFSKMISFVDKNEKGSYSINEFVPGKSIINLPYVAPKKEDGKELKTFENIAVSACGNKKLAMFKADIDNLGLVFSSSLGEKLISFSRYAQMSSQLNYFFSSFYAWFVSENPEYKDKIYTVFSGGDDLCILGAWDSVLDFANEFKKQIDIFTNCNPSVTLSAGIGIFSSNTPVNIMAEMTEELLEKSKHRKEKANGTERLVKNGITVFDTTVSWSDFDDLLRKGKKLKEFLEVAKSGNLEEGLSTGIVYKMLDFANRAERASSGNFNFKDLLWQSNLFYATRSIKSDSAKELIKELGKSSEDIKKSRIAVSYALYTQR